MSRYSLCNHSSPNFKMVRFLGVTSILLFSHIALVAADSMPPVHDVQRDAIVSRLFGRKSSCGKGNSESWCSIHSTPRFVLWKVKCDDSGCCNRGVSYCCNNGYGTCKSWLPSTVNRLWSYLQRAASGCPIRQTCGKVNGQPLCF